MPEIHLTPEEISAHGSLSRGEKLEWLSDLKFQLELESSRGVAGLDQVEARMAVLKQAISRVKRETASGRKRWRGGPGQVPERAAHA